MSHPTIPQLLAAVRGFLEDAQPALDGRLAFHARVAANVLAIIERELEQAPDAAEAAALAPFGGAAALCAALREGRLAPDDPAVLSAVRLAVLARLATDNPRYPTYQRLCDHPGP
jgi:hypothetical protein